MLTCLERLAAWYLGWIGQRRAHRSPLDPELARFDVESLEYKDQALTIVGKAPMLVILAEEAATLLDHYHCENYLQFDMSPRHSSELRPIRVTIQWADGESPAQKAIRLQDELEHLRHAQAQSEASTSDEGPQL